jgi:hypothetical protein
MWFASLTRGWVCHLQLELAFANAIILGCEFGGAMTKLCSPRFEAPPQYGESGVRITPPPPGTGWLVFPTAREATVEIFEPYCTRARTLQKVLRSLYCTY